MAILFIGILHYLSVRRPRRQPQKDSAPKGSSPASIRYEKPELTGEYAYKEMDNTERRTAELAGDETRFELDGTPARHTGNLQAV